METEAKILLEVKRALTNHEFVLHWQPQCNTRTERIVGLEALVRWQHPSRGIVMPGAFIPVLERNNFIASLDLYVWEEACRHIRSWIDRGGVPIPVSVNISRADLYAIDVVEALEGLVSRYDLDHRLLELEITESAYMESPDQLVGAVMELRRAGFTVEMDDFGSGYSSLNTLKDVPVDVLKLDMGFLGCARELARRPHPRLHRAHGALAEPARHRRGSGNPEAGSIPGQHRVRVHAGLSVLASGRSRDVRAHVDGRRSRVRQAADH